MRRYVTDRLGFFAVGLQHSSSEFEKFLDQYQIPYVDLETTNSAHVYRTFGHHWTPEGHTFVAEKIETLFKK